MDGIQQKPLTVSFSEPGFVAKLNQENLSGSWFTLSDKQKQQLGSPMGPVNPQGLNRYSYVLNNPIQWTDPNGHAPAPLYNCENGRPCLFNLINSAVQLLADAVLRYGFGVGASSSASDGEPSFQQGSLQRHFLKHQGEGVGYRDANEYLQSARNMIREGLGGNSSDVLAVRRADGTTIFWRQSTEEFLALGRGDKEIITFFKPNKGFEYWLEQISK